MPTPRWHHLKAPNRIDKKTDKPDGKPMLSQRTFSSFFRATIYTVKLHSLTQSVWGLTIYFQAFNMAWINLMFCWPCIIVYQYSETNVMYFLFILLRIKGLYMFPALLAHPQEVLHKRHLVYCVRVMSVGCTRTESELKSWCSQLT
jgi:hypothetical protein